MADSRTVVANAAYPVALEHGRHLHPGEVVEVELTARHAQLIADGHLAVVDEPTPSEPPPPPKSSTRTPPSAGDPNEQEQ